MRWLMYNIYIRTGPAGDITPDKKKFTEPINEVETIEMDLDMAQAFAGLELISIRQKKSTGY